MLITGGGRGIGRATALRMAAAGDAIAVLDRDETAGEQTAADIAAGGGVALFLACDVARAAEVERAVTEAVRALGRLDVVVNNAAVGVFARTVETTTEQEWDDTLAVNLKSVFLVSRAAIPHLRAAGGGAIVNVSSIHAFASSEGVAPYAAAKGGVLALTRTMALDLASDRIRVVAVIPGATDTPMLHRHAEQSGLSLAELGFPSEPTAVGRIAAPDEVAAVIQFAASPAASAVTGSALIADGGILAKF